MPPKVLEKVLDTHRPGQTGVLPVLSLSTGHPQTDTVYGGILEGGILDTHKGAQLARR